MVLPSSEEEEEFAQSYSWNKYTGKNCYENLESIDAFNAWNAWSLDEDDYADVCKNRCETTAGCNVAKFMRGNAPGWAKNWKKCTLYKTLPAFTDATTCQNYNKFDTYVYEPDVDCAGAWSQCDCSTSLKTYGVTRPKSGAGAACTVDDWATQPCSCCNPETEFRTQTANGEECTPFSTCAEGTQYESAEPTEDSDRGCTDHSVCDPTTHFQSAAGTADSDTVCAPLTTCTDSEYESVESTPTQDRTCAPLTTCTNSQYQSVAPTPTSNRSCAALTVCADGEWQSQPPTATTDRQCSSNCTGDWEDWGACSATCGPDGKRSRSYVVTAEPKGVGTCPNRNQTQEEPCNRHACAPQWAVDIFIPLATEANAASFTSQIKNSLRTAYANLFVHDVFGTDHSAFQNVSVRVTDAGVTLAVKGVPSDKLERAKEIAQLSPQTALASAADAVALLTTAHDATNPVPIAASWQYDQANCHGEHGFTALDNGTYDDVESCKSRCHATSGCNAAKVRTKHSGWIRNFKKCYLYGTNRGAFQSDNPASISSVCGGHNDSWDTYILDQDCEGDWSSCNCDDQSQTFAVTRSASGRGAACTGDGSSTTYVEYTGTIVCPGTTVLADGGKNPNDDSNNADRLSACKDACDNHSSGQCNGFIYDTEENKCYLKTFDTPFDLSKCETNPLNGLRWSTYVAEARLEDGYQQSCACAAEADADCVGAWGEWGPCSAACGTGFRTKSYAVTSGTCANEGQQRTEECNTHRCEEAEASEEVDGESGKKGSSSVKIFLGGAIVLAVIALVALKARKSSRKK